MIYLTTGGNGAGKTLFSLKDVREQQLKENRPVYFHGFTAKQVLLDWGWQEFDPKKWQDLPDGSICIFDECQNEFPAKVQGELPDYINAVAQFRRKRGFDFWMITPHPSLIHVNIRRLIESPSWHRHMKRTAGTTMASELKFNFAELKCEQPGSGARGVVSMRAFPKEVYDWYESASMHTGKVRIPKQFWWLVVCVVLVPLMIWFAVTRVYGNATKHAPEQEIKQPGGGPVGQQAAPVRKLTAAEYADERTPRFAGFTHTAPVYDDITKPVDAPYPAACVEMRGDCRCYSQQATRLQVPKDTCAQIVRYGFFVDWQKPEKPMRADFRPQQQAQQHQQGQSMPLLPQTVPLIAFESKGSAFYNVKGHDLGNGHLEVTASRGLEWRELDWTPLALEMYLESVIRIREEDPELVRSRNAERAAKRAKTRVRQLCKAMGADTMLTLTYHENVTDLERCKADVKEFNRRVKRVIPGFRFVAAFEQQDRGAWHVHMATERLPATLPSASGVKVKSFNVIRAIWRGVTKASGGNIDVANTKRNSQRSPARIAQYIAGYIIKAFKEGALHSNRWTKYGDFDVPPPIQLGQVSSIRDAVEVAYSLISDLHQIAMDRLDRWKDWFVVHAELPTKKRPVGR
eukprot:gene6501-6357_t